jgi:hypothetical protein
MHKPNTKPNTTAVKTGAAMNIVDLKKRGFRRPYCWARRGSGHERIRDPAATSGKARGCESSVEHWQSCLIGYSSWCTAGAVCGSFNGSSPMCNPPKEQTDGIRA